jgi:hypothetical protein
MEPEISFLYPQQLSALPYVKLGEASSHPHTLFSFVSYGINWLEHAKT